MTTRRGTWYSRSPIRTLGARPPQLGSGRWEARRFVRDLNIRVSCIGALLALLAFAAGASRPAIVLAGLVVLTWIDIAWMTLWLRRHAPTRR